MSEKSNTSKLLDEWLSKYTNCGSEFLLLGMTHEPTDMIELVLRAVYITSSRINPEIPRPDDARSKYNALVKGFVKDRKEFIIEEHKHLLSGLTLVHAMVCSFIDVGYPVLNIRHKGLITSIENDEFLIVGNENTIIVKYHGDTYHMIVLVYDEVDKMMVSMAAAGQEEPDIESVKYVWSTNLSDVVRRHNVKFKRNQIRCIHSGEIA